MQITVGQFSQRAPLMLTLPPKPQRFADLSENAGTMMIYHRFMCGSGHFHLPKLICYPQYVDYLGFPQTTLCTV
jgi:hypothetical protein